MTQEQVVAGLRARARTSSPTCSAMHLTPGVGIDFGALAQHPRCCSPGVYLLSSVFSWVQAYIMAGVTQRTVYRLRRTSTRSSAGCRSSTSTATRAATC